MVVGMVAGDEDASKPDACAGMDALACAHQGLGYGRRHDRRRGGRAGAMADAGATALA